MCLPTGVCRLVHAPDEACNVFQEGESLLIAADLNQLARGLHTNTICALMCTALTTQPQQHLSVALELSAV